MNSENFSFFYFWILSDLCLVKSPLILKVTSSEFTKNLLCYPSMTSIVITFYYDICLIVLDKTLSYLRTRNHTFIDHKCVVVIKVIILVK